MQQIVSLRAMSFIIAICVVCFSTFLSCNHSDIAAKIGADSFKNKDSSLIQLGKYLFYDRRLSVNSTKACATCHNPSFAFTDGYKKSLGAYADILQHNTLPLFNLNTFTYLTNADSTIHGVAQQINNPLYNQHPVEMGLKGNEALILQRLNNDALYDTLSKAAFGNSQLTIEKIKQAITTFILTINSYQSPYDHYIQGDTNALNEQQKKGIDIFFSKNIGCTNCHGGKNFNQPIYINQNGAIQYYYNIGLYNINQKGYYPANEQGLFALTKQFTDMGKYRIPTLRNLSLTGPYFHDGSCASLTDAVDIALNGGRIITEGAFKGNGIVSPFKSPLIQAIKISDVQKKQLISFLIALTDTSFTKSTWYSSPFIKDETQ